MQLKHFEHLANLERSIIKEQFVRAANRSHPTMPFGPKIGKEKRLKGKQKPKEKRLGSPNQPRVVTLTAQTGNYKEDPPNMTRKFPGYDHHLSLGLGPFPGSKSYPKHPTEAEIRDQRGTLAAMAANDGLTPVQGGALGLMNEHAAMLRPSGKPLYRPRLKTKTRVM